MSSLTGAGRAEARRSRKVQEASIAKAKQKEETRIAEEEDVIARKRASGAARGIGRRALVRTTEAGIKGTNVNLGG